MAPPLFIDAIAPPINTLNTQLIETKVTTINYGRDLVTLAKMYTEESKYSKKDNNFKVQIFKDANRFIIKGLKQIL